MADKIFINYRRDDSIGTAGRLHDRLAETFGQQNIFMDVDSIPAGVDFVADLNSQVAACRVFLAVIGPNWLEAKDESGARRFDNPNDFVTIEIAAALARDIRVIPVLIDNARMPNADKLPDPIKPLVRRNAVEVRNSQFGRDAETLIARMREALGKDAAKPSRWRVWTIAGAAVVALLLLVGWGGYALIQNVATKVMQTAKQPDAPSSKTPTVLGGVNSSIADWPWLVSIFQGRRFICNGTLIAPRMVLSTALCVARGQPANYEVASATDDGKYIKIGRRMPVTKIVLHPEFVSNLGKNDIAILELGAELPPPFATISGRRSADPNAGSLALVGTIDFRSNPGNVIQSSVPISDDASCALKTELEGTICAGFERGGGGACPGTGSAGGPLVVFSGAGRKYQIGIVSMADCSVPEEAFGIYTRISLYVDWIKKVVPDVLSEPATEVKR
jgi:Trypsin/TIR domain